MKTDFSLAQSFVSFAGMYLELFIAIAIVEDY